MATITDEQKKQILEKLSRYFSETHEGRRMYGKNARERLQKVRDKLIDTLSNHAPWDLWNRVDWDIDVASEWDDHLMMWIWLNDSLVRSSLSSGYIDLFQLVNNYVTIRKNTPVGLWHGMIIKGSKTPLREYRSHIWFVEDSFDSASHFAKENGIRMGYSKSYSGTSTTKNIVDSSGHRDPEDRYTYIYTD